MDNFQDKTALVTGGGSGIGRGLALELASEGMTVAVADLRLDGAESVVAEITAAGGKAFAIEVDVTSVESLERAAGVVEETAGGLHLLCANAGVIAKMAPIDAHTVDDWEYTFSVNVLGIVKTVQVFLPLLRDTTGDAHIVNTASLGGLLADQGLPISAYASSKYACVAFSESLRAELAPEGIGVSVLCPGMVDSNLMSTSVENRPAALSQDAPPASQRSTMQPPTVIGESISAQQNAQMVIRAIRANRLHIITHAADRDLVADRFKQIDDDFAFAAGFGHD